MPESSLHDYSDAYVLKGTISLVAGGANNNKEVIVKTCAPFTNCISKIKNTQVYNTKDIDVVMPMYNLIEYSDYYLKTSGSLWQYHRDKLFLATGVIDYLPDTNNNSASFNFKQNNNK